MAKAKIAALIMAHSEQRGEHYEIRWGEPSAQATGASATRAEAFELPTLDGGRLDLGALIGRRPIVLVFWASWCAPCLEEAPHLVELHRRYGESVAFASVSIDGGAPSRS